MGDRPTKRQRVSGSGKCSNQKSLVQMPQQKTSESGITSLLETWLPQELLLMIRNLLEPWEWAALTLTSHTMMTKMGTNALRLPRNILYNLLALLEQQGLYPDNVLCPVCVKFHSLNPATSSISRACEGTPYGPGWTRGKGEVAFPSHLIGVVENPSWVVTIPFNLASAVMRVHNFNITPPLLQASDLNYSFQEVAWDDSSVKWNFNTSCEFCIATAVDPVSGMEEAHLFMKQCTVVSPLTLTSGFGLKDASIGLLQRLEGKTAQKTGNFACCPDMELTQHYLECFQVDHPSGNGCSCLWGDDLPCHPFHQSRPWKKEFQLDVETCRSCGANLWLCVGP
ncbi:hypothetical protein QBC40DRAFT_299034 [Triangularia verruculosa]|uniref:Uncharacterized protein n=1 Tax=Triangularia verruculosa TaxID=2587418 RepID=A0AAN6XC61_9PEZI|nr:hypothetical protein QBC40DRAFT_299034 [Triangularia verruculosa]